MTNRSNHINHQKDLAVLSLKPGSIALISFSSQSTEYVGNCIGEEVGIGDVVLLSGKMGTGKTTLTRGIADGIKCETQVRSPTFVLVNDHEGGRLCFSHCDLYRIGDPREIEELAIEERLDAGAVAIEWPEMGRGYLPDDALHVRLDFAVHPEERKILIEGTGKRGSSLLIKVMGSLGVPISSDDGSHS